MKKTLSGLIIMPFDYTTLPHAGIRSLAPYVPGKSIEEVAREQGLSEISKLASNENPLGCSPYAQQALKQLTTQQLSLYPTSIDHPLRHKLATHLGIHSEMLTLSNGSDMLFYLLLVCFALHNNKHILTHDYAFISYKIQAEGLGIPVVSTPIQANWQVDIDAIIQACNVDTALIFIANPNNPTGALIQQTDIQYLLSNIPETTLLVLDEAYYEYAYQQKPYSIDLLSNHSNLVITRTFSKAYGLAGLRLGYAITNPQISSLLYRMQLPFAVNQAAMITAITALDDRAFIKQTQQITAKGLLQLQQGLDALNLTYIPSFANFITINCQMDGGFIFNALQQYGIIVRPLMSYQMFNYIRVSIGTEKQNQLFLDKLAYILLQNKNKDTPHEK